MRCSRWVPGTRRQFIRQKRREIKAAKAVLAKLRFGCAIHDAFDGTKKFQEAVYAMAEALAQMDAITKPLS